MGTVDLLTPAAYARRRGVTRQAVFKAIAAGRITAIATGGRRMIDPTVADIQWSKNTDQKQFERANSARISAAPGDDVYSAARARREVADAERAELELEKLHSSLVDRQAALRGMAHAEDVVRQAVLAVAPRVAAELAALTDAFAIEQRLAAELRGVLLDLSHQVNEQ